MSEYAIELGLVVTLVAVAILLMGGVWWLHDLGMC